MQTGGTFVYADDSLMFFESNALFVQTNNLGTIMLLFFESCHEEVNFEVNAFWLKRLLFLTQSRNTQQSVSYILGCMRR